MTSNQIAYANLKETERHNRVGEVETQRHNIAYEDIQRFSATENQRHNLANENYNLLALSETTRHNLAGENYNLLALSETARHNRAGENFNLLSLAESQRHNVATEQYNLSYLSEVNRHNEASEQLDRSKNRITSNWYQTQADLQTRAQNLDYRKAVMSTDAQLLMNQRNNYVDLLGLGQQWDMHTQKQEYNYAKLDQDLYLGEEQITQGYWKMGLDFGKELIKGVGSGLTGAALAAAGL